MSSVRLFTQLVSALFLVVVVVLTVVLVDSLEVPAVHAHSLLQLPGKVFFPHFAEAH